MATPRDVQLQEQLRGLSQERLAIEAEIAASAAGSLERKQAELELIQVNTQRLNALVELQRVRGRLTTDRLLRAREGLRDLAEEEQRLSNLVDLEKQRQGIIKETASVLKGMMGINDSFQQRFVQGILEGRINLSSLGSIATELTDQVELMGGKTAFFASGLLKAKEAALSLGNTIVQSTKELALSQDQALASFSRMTGQTGALRNELLGIEIALQNYGVSLEGATRTQGALFAVVSNFTELTTKERNELALTTAMLDRFGVGAETVAQNSEIMSRQMGLSASQQSALNIQLFTFAQESGIATSKVASDFGRLAPQLMAFGNQATAVFKELEFVSKQTGMSVDNMLNVTNQFNRFDTAANSVGKLNAILGGPYLSTIQMVMATNPAERMQMMAEAVTSAGRSFEQLSYYERLALKEAMGLQSVGELALVMRGNFDMLNNSVMMTGDQFEDLERQEREFNSVLDEYKQLIRSLAAEMLPFVRGLADMLSYAAELTNTFTALGSVAVGITASFAAMGPVAQLFGAGLLGAGTAGATAAVGLVALTGVVSALFYAFTRSGSPKFYEMGYHIAGGFSALGAAAGSAAQGVGFLGGTIDSISRSMKEIPDMKVTQFKTIMTETRKATEEARSAGAGASSLALGVARATSFASQGAGGGTQNVNVPLSVYLDGNQIAKHLFNGMKPV